MESESESAMLDVRDVAKLLKMPVSTVYQQAKKDALPFTSLYIGRTLRFRRAEVEQFVKG